MNDQKPRERWISASYEGVEHVCDTEKEAIALAWRGDKSNVIHVIEYSAYEQEKLKGESCTLAWGKELDDQRLEIEALERALKFEQDKNAELRKEVERLKSKDSSWHDQCVEMAAENAKLIQEVERLKEGQKLKDRGFEIIQQSFVSQSKLLTETTKECDKFALEAASLRLLAERQNELVSKCLEALESAIDQLRPYAAGERDKSFDRWQYEWREVETKNDSDYAFYPNHIDKSQIKELEAVATEIREALKQEGE